MSNAMDQYIKHMEFLGYDVVESDEEGKYVMTHETKGSSIVRSNGKGAVFYAIWALDNYSHSSRSACLEAINDLNCDSSVGVYALHFGINDQAFLKIGAYYAGEYDKTSFGYFLDLFSTDTMTRVVQNGTISFLVTG